MPYLGGPHQQGVLLDPKAPRAPQPPLEPYVWKPTFFRDHVKPLQYWEDGTINIRGQGLARMTRRCSECAGSY
jgi:hypothetical protein